MSPAASNGNVDHNNTSSGSSTATGTIPPPGTEVTPRAKKHMMRIPGMPSLDISSTKPLLGTPYAFSHSPFEYPFPSPTPASTAAPTAHIPLYIPSPAHSPFPFAPTLLSRGNGYGHAFGSGAGVQSLGLGLPVWRRSASPPHPKFSPSRTDPPVPPRLIEKVQSLAGGMLGRDNEGKGKGEEREEKEGRLMRLEEGGSHGDDVEDEPERAREDAAEKSRPGSPDVT